MNDHKIWEKAPDVFNSKYQVAVFVSEHFKRSKRAVQNDLSSRVGDDMKHPLCMPTADGKQYEKENVRAYVEQSKLVARGDRIHEDDLRAIQDTAALKKRKLRKECERLSIEIKSREFQLEKEQGKYIEKDLLDLELASRAALFDSGLRTMIRGNARKWVDLVNGDRDQVSTLIEDMLSLLDSQLNQFARMDRFEVVFGDPSEPGNERL